MLYFIFLKYVSNIQRLNFTGQESKKQFAVYDSDTPVTLKHGQGHQTWYELTAPKQDSNLMQVCKTLLEQCACKKKKKSFCQIRQRAIIFLGYVQKSNIVVYFSDLFYVINSPIKFQLNWLRT